MHRQRAGSDDRAPAAPPSGLTVNLRLSDSTTDWERPRSRSMTLRTADLELSEPERARCRCGSSSDSEACGDVGSDGEAVLPVVGPEPMLCCWTAGDAVGQSGL